VVPRAVTETLQGEGEVLVSQVEAASKGGAVMSAGNWQDIRDPPAERLTHYSASSSLPMPDSAKARIWSSISSCSGLGPSGLGELEREATGDEGWVLGVLTPGINRFGSSMAKRVEQSRVKCS
jgi:hypothetical protein